MKIGIISTLRADPWGGSEELWSAMAHVALAKGMSVTVCFLQPHSNHPRHEALRRAGATVVCQATATVQRLLSRVDSISHRVSSGLRRRLSPVRDLLGERPDVVLINSGGAMILPDVVETFNKRQTPPYVVLSQANYGAAPEESYRTRLAEFYGNARSALFVSEANLRATEKQLLKKLSNGRVVRNPVNLTCLDPVSWPSVAQGVKLASIGRLTVAAKGQDILLEALSDPRWQDRDWSLSIYGGGPDGPYLRGLCKYIGLDARVSFRGQTNDIRAVWQAHHALLLPSRVEGMPLVVVEAMLCGRPIIATAVAGVPEWVKDKRSGFLAEAPSVQHYGEALECAWQERESWQAMGNCARDDALLLYDPQPGETLLSLLVAASASRK